MAEGSTMFERVGGEEFFETLTARFYAAVEHDVVLRPLYPADPEGFEAARLHLQWFLVQYWGGPPLFDERRGSPRLRMRHAPFAIGQGERDAWLVHMTEAVKAAGLKPLDETQMLGYFITASSAMMNTRGPTPSENPTEQPS
jgi:hemoglobin